MAGKTFIKLLITILLATLIIIYFFVSKYSNLKQPSRLANIPNNAEWVGSKDGGNWYLITRFYQEILSE